jgi:hypothetical protein
VRPDLDSEQSFVYRGLVVDSAQITALQRSAAMLTRGQKLPVDRDELMALCEEVLESRQLLQRLGADLRSVAARAPRPPTSSGSAPRRQR